MYHSRFTGNHYDAGVKFGSSLYNKGITLDGNTELTEEQVLFTKESLKAYLRYYPQVLDEVKGIAAGQRMSYLNLAYQLFSTYCKERNSQAACFAFQNSEHIILSRNSEYRIGCTARFDSVYYALDGGYVFIGNTSSMVQLEDGINEHGLACGLSFLPQSTLCPGLNGGMIIRLLLETCKTTQEAINKIEQLQVAGAYEILIADSSGEFAVVECSSQDVKPRAVCRKNSSIIAAKNLVQSGVLIPKQQESTRITERMEKLQQALDSTELYSVKYAKNMLGGRCGFLCRAEDETNFEIVWSTVYDIKEQRIYRSEGNPETKKFQEDTRLKFAK